ncbi:MAG: 16S rRNA (adenine(1518)-N(6)/adenine(1519)-N(6))-dimethyltransferase RsmA [Spirochaetia bacterium]
MNPDSPAEIRALLADRGLALKKRWGQNFLVNRGARERLVALLDPAQGQRVWEIGPGLGSMTGLLLARTLRVVAFEVDRGLCRYLEESLGRQPSFSLVEGDFLQTWKAEMSAHGVPDLMLGNLPYSSASLMIADLIEAGVRPPRMVFTVQRELADRMQSGPGSKSYSSFSVLCQSCFHVAGHGDLKPGSFYPVPEVVSSIVSMKPREDAPKSDELRLLSLLVRGLFSSRRKTLRNNLGSQWLETVFGSEGGLDAGREAGLEALRGEGIDPGARAEELSPEVFVHLARALAAAAKGLPAGEPPDAGPTGPSTP